ncbi:MAG: adenine-specific methyltransferase EcoRI family protein [Muribaculaceae bacterium]|nr:adenine-specific methyltransferase EcoRI family protein [Muribaculaceae bacterium]
MAGNRSLNAAAKAKQDEFYTQMPDIAQELKHYKRHFKGKVVLCNCDDPFESNFFKFFALNFNAWGLKKLICTCFDGSSIVGRELNLFNYDEQPTSERKAYKVELTEVSDVNGDGATDLLDVKEILKSNPPVLLSGNGDFRSDECIELLKEADIVVTNPPFSLFREFVAQLIEYDKKFLIIGNQNAITYKEIFPLIRNNQLWLGYKSGDMAFTVPDSYEPRATRYWVDESGQKWRSMGNICWYTNLDHKKRHEELDLYKTYSPEEYPKYDNYDAIEVGRVADIPMDYEGYMGVPIIFLDKYNPEQFEIYGATESEGKGFSNGLWSSQSGVSQPVTRGDTALQANIHQTQESLDCSMTQEIQRSTERANMQESLFETSIVGMIKNAEGKIMAKLRMLG